MQTDGVIHSWLTKEHLTHHCKVATVLETNPIYMSVDKYGPARGVTISNIDLLIIKQNIDFDGPKTASE